MSYPSFVQGLNKMGVAVPANRALMLAQSMDPESTGKVAFADLSKTLHHVLDVKMRKDDTEAKRLETERLQDAVRREAPSTSASVEKSAPLESTFDMAQQQPSTGQRQSSQPASRQRSRRSTPLPVDAKTAYAQLEHEREMLTIREELDNVAALPQGTPRVHG